MDMSAVVDDNGVGTPTSRVLEFYSGIGGMRYSLMAANVNAQVVEAFDINDVANDVYEYNFGHRPHQGNIQTLTAADLDRYEADAWLLSPPCQPYTRQGLRKQSKDSRASSFLKILELIPQTKVPPSMLFVENVVGFETSDTHAKLIETLKSLDFVVLEFMLSPLQFGIPYSRPRYFCLAKKKPMLFNHQLLGGDIIASPAVLYELDSCKFVTSDHAWNSSDSLSHTCESIERFLELKISSCQVDVNISSMPLNSCDEQNDSIVDQYYVPLSIIERYRLPGV